MENSVAPLCSWKKIYAVTSAHKDKPSGDYYDVSLYADKVVFKLVKSFVTAAQANQHGLIGMLFNKLFSKAMKEESFEMALQEVKSAEHYNVVDPIGRDINTLMFWNLPLEDAKYENVYFSVTPEKGDFEAAKEAFKKALPAVKWKN